EDRAGRAVAWPVVFDDFVRRSERPAKYPREPAASAALAAHSLRQALEQTTQSRGFILGRLHSSHTRIVDQRLAAIVHLQLSGAQDLQGFLERHRLGPGATIDTALGAQLGALTGRAARGTRTAAAGLGAWRRSEVAVFDEFELRPRRRRRRGGLRR